MSRSKSLAIALGFVMAVAGYGEAQTIADSFEQLQSLVKPGELVTVRDTAGVDAKGSIASLSSSSLTLIVQGTPRELRESDVMTIFARRPDSLVNGAMWGLLAGAALGGVVAAIGCDDCGGSPAGAFVAAAVLAGVGAGIDALIVTHQPIYQRRAGAVALGVVPLFRGNPRGAAFTLAF